MTHKTQELPIARHFIHNALAQGYELALHDGEEIAVPRTANFDALNEGLASTDMDTLIVYLGDKRVGSVLFIWGNGTDVLSDHSDNAVINALVEPTSEYSDGLADG
jgi:hypothetical protein